MKASKSKTTASNLQTQTKQENLSFFKKDGEAMFFPGASPDLQTKPFFSPENRHIPAYHSNNTPFFSPSTIQAKLTIGQTNDKYEQEADAMADKVVQKLAQPETEQAIIQTKCNDCGQEEQLQKKEEIEETDKGIQEKPIFESEKEPEVQRMETDEEESIQMVEEEEDLQLKVEGHEEAIPDIQEKPILESDTNPEVQTKTDANPPATEPVVSTTTEISTTSFFESPIQKEEMDQEEGSPDTEIDLQRKPVFDSGDDLTEGKLVMAKSESGQIDTSSGIEQKLNSSKGDGKPLPEDTRSSMESSFGADFSNVNIHTGSDAVEMSKGLGAQAFTHGNDVYFNKGKYDTHSSGGQHLLAHELTHTIQQGGSEKSILNKEVNSIIQRNGEEEGLDSNETQSFDQDKIDKLLDHLKEEKWDVDSLVADLNDWEMMSLKINDRINLLKYLADDYFVTDEDEQSIIRLITSTPEHHLSIIIDSLRSDNSMLLEKLESKIHGEEYKEYHSVLREVIFKALEPDEVVKGIETGIILPWAAPGIIHSFWNSRFYYEEVSFTDNGKIYIKGYHSFYLKNPFINIEETLDPMEIIGVYFHFEEEYMNAPEGKYIYMPAINFFGLYNKQFKQEAGLIIDVGLLMLGGVGIINATTKAGKIIAALELALAASDLLINEFRSKITTTEEGKKFLKVWDTITLLLGIYTLTRIVLKAPQVFKNLRQSYKNFKTNSKNSLNTDELNQLDNEVDEVLKKSDEVIEEVNVTKNQPEGLISDKKVTYGKNKMTKFRKHSQHMREVARKMGIEIPKSPSNPNTEKAMESFVEKVVSEGDFKSGPYMTFTEVQWHKLEDGIVIRKMDGEFISFFDYSKGGVATQWDNI